MAVTTIGIEKGANSSPAQPRSLATTLVITEVFFINCKIRLL